MMTQTEKQKFHVVLVKPSKYDKDGYVISWLRAILVSNSLATMNALTEQAQACEALGPAVEVVNHFYDETVTRLSPQRIARHIRRHGGRGLVCMVGVQTNQFPRAVDLSTEFMAEGLKVMIGGFHVSGSIEMLPRIPDEIQAAMDLGITVVAGEAENRWDELLREAYDDRLKPMYNFVSAKPNIAGSPPPFAEAKKLRHFLPSRQSSFDAGRGCPFQCSFCTIVNVQGRTMRGRSADDIELLIRRNHAQGIREYFITDDNFARHSNWEGIADRIIYLKEVEGLRVTLMIQADTLAHRIPRFISKMAHAGCRRVFIGMESVNPDNLALVGKRQNRLSEYRTMLQAWRNARVVTIAGYIIGFPGDTYESIMRDVEFLKNELPLEFAEFFVLTPLPGSKDHRDLYVKGVALEKEMNAYDLTQPCVEHPTMSREELMRAYNDAWKSFYSHGHVKTILKRRKDSRRRGIAMHMIWFRSAVFVEKVHPLLTGFLRIKGRRRRSPRLPVESIPIYYARRIKELALWFVRMLVLLAEMRYLFVKTSGNKSMVYLDKTIVPDDISEKKSTLSDDREVFDQSVDKEPSPRECVGPAG
ncbi:MAG: radical SAM protein [Gammaproteobacteria bacterium]|nr:radical SAM protein [Gammaproteobacteria bacterium]